MIQSSSPRNSKIFETQNAKIVKLSGNVSSSYIDFFQLLNFDINKEDGAGQYGGRIYSKLIEPEKQGFKAPLKKRRINETNAYNNN